MRWPPEPFNGSGLRTRMPTELTQQAEDGSGIACGALDDARRATSYADADAAASAAEAQIQAAERAANGVSAVARDNPADPDIGTLEARATAAVAQAKECARAARTIAVDLKPVDTTKKKGGKGWLLALAAAAAGILALAS